MNLEEVINQEREKSKRMYEKSIKLFPSFEGRKCTESAEEHEQLAEWLEELKELRKCKEQWESGEEVFLWWIEDKNVAGQREFKVAENGQLMW